MFYNYLPSYEEKELRGLIFSGGFSDVNSNYLHPTAASTGSTREYENYLGETNRLYPGRE